MPPEKTSRVAPIEPRLEPRRWRRRRSHVEAETEDGARSFERLRRVILGPEQARIEHLEERPAVSDASIGAVLPEAVALADAERGQALAVALEPSVTHVVTAMARRRPELYAEILAPTIGAAVRKAVREALATILERFDYALQRSLSIDGIRWRIEAARTGRPLAEVVLSHTLAYRVEQIFLIQTKTSLVLLHLVDPSLEQPASDPIAAMLGAIDAFAREVFRPMPTEAHVEEFKIDELTVYVDRDPLITLAAVVRGSPAVEIGQRLTEALTRVRVLCQSELAHFTGDVAPFEAARPVLEPLLVMKRRPPPRRAQVLLAAAGAALALAVLVALILATTRHAADARLRQAYLDAFRDEPGVVVTRAEVTDGAGRLSGFRDPLAEAPAAVAARRGLAPAAFELAPFVSLDPRIVQRRAKRALEPPPTVRLSLEDGTLHAAGVAPRAWTDDARLLARGLPGVARYDEHALRSRERLVDALRDAAAGLANIAIHFERDETRASNQEATLERAAEHARSALQAAAEAQMGACVQVIGYADLSGTEEHNRSLSERRAAAVAASLQARGVDGAHLQAKGAGTSAARRVNLRLELDESGAGPACGAPP